MSQARARRGTAPSSNIGPILVFALIGILIVVWLAWAGGSYLSGRGEQVSASGLFEVLAGKAVWPAWATVLLLLIVVASIALAILVLRKIPRKSFVHKEMERKASVMASPRETTGITLKDVKKSTQRLVPSADLSDPMQCGQRVGMMMDGRTPLYASWEWVATCVAGPRAGKSTSFAMPRIMSAPGACMVTENKPGLYAATHGHRSEVGTVWLSDVQAITPAGGLQDWWWNPLRGIQSQSEAAKLASYFVAASRTDANARVDSYFDGGAQALLALMILAAAVSGGDLQHVYGWLAEPNRDLPAKLLRNAGEELAAERLTTASKLNDRQRDGLYDMARRFVSVIEEPRYAASVLPPKRVDYGDADTALGRLANRHPCAGPEFIIDDFVRSSDTLYALSMEGPDAATPLTTALIGSVFEAAIRYARECGGRLPVPMLAILDEAANICKLPDLPNWYSHFGSQGIVVWTFLQSLPQAQRVWGQDGTDALFSGSNLHIYAGASKELCGTSYLSNVSSLIGHHDVSRWSASVSSHGPLTQRNMQQGWSKEQIFTVDELSALPQEYAIVFASGNPAVLIRKESAVAESSPFRESILRSTESMELIASSPAQRAVMAAPSVQTLAMPEPVRETQL